MNVQIEDSWKAHLQPEFDKDYFYTLTNFVREAGNQRSPFTINANSPSVIPCTMGIGNQPTPDLYFMSSIGPST